MNSAISVEHIFTPVTGWKTRLASAATGATNLLLDERGVTAIEYALIAALIALAIVAAMSGLGSTIESIFSDISTGI